MMPKQAILTNLLYIRKAARGDAIRLAPRLRQADKDEAYAVNQQSPLDALASGFKDSCQCFTAEYKGEPALMFGVVKASHEIGAIWMLCQDLNMVQSISVLRQAPEIIAKLHKQFPILANNVDMRNKLHLKWLEHLGFFMGDIQNDFNGSGLPFQHFFSLSETFKRPICADQQPS